MHQIYYEPNTPLTFLSQEIQAKILPGVFDVTKRKKKKKKRNTEMHDNEELETEKGKHLLNEKT